MKPTILLTYQNSILLKNSNSTLCFLHYEKQNLLNRIKIHTYMRKLVFLLSIFISLLGFSESMNVKSLLDSALVNYKSGNYQKALEYYKQIEQMGNTSAYLYYNIGNAYFRTHNIAKAILYYERAKLLNPNDPDIDHNLKFANTFITDKINELPEPFYLTWFRNFTYLFSPNTWAWGALILFITICTLIFFNFLTSSLLLSKVIKTAAAFLFVIWIITIISAYSSYQRATSKKYAIITTETVEIKSSPDEKSTSLFVLHEGTKVYIKDTFEDWVEIRIADGNTGWIKENDLERI